MKITKRIVILTNQVSCQITGNYLESGLNTGIFGCRNLYV